MRRETMMASVVQSHVADLSFTERKEGMEVRV